MNPLKGQRLYVPHSASRVRRQLKGHGLGVRKVESNGRNAAVVIHTATGDHLRELQSLLGKLEHSDMKGGDIKGGDIKGGDIKGGDIKGSERPGA